MNTFWQKNSINEKKNYICRLLTTNYNNKNEKNFTFIIVCNFIKHECSNIFFR